MDRQEAEAAIRPLSPDQSVFEILGSVRALVADEADLLAAEANVAVRTLVACVIIAVGADQTASSFHSKEMGEQDCTLQIRRIS